MNELILSGPGALSGSRLVSTSYTSADESSRELSWLVGVGRLSIGGRLNELEV